MNCLKLLLRLCRIIFARFDHLPEQVKPDEMTTHFIFVREYFSQAKNIVRTGAFLPPKDKRLSIYRTRCCNEEKIWWLGDWYVGRKRGKEVLARGDLQALEFARVDLEITPDRNPHPWHANVIGWPESKPLQKIKAAELAIKARLFVKPEFPT